MTKEESTQTMAKAKDKTQKKSAAPLKAKADAAVKTGKGKRSARLNTMLKALEPEWKIAPFAASAPPAPDRNGRPITIEDLFEFQLVGDPNVSPDGTRVAVSVTHIDKDANEYRSAIWLFPLNGDDPIRLTTGRWTDGSPRWSPDGNWLAFTSKRESKTAQIWLLPTGGGEARQLTELDNDSSDIDWAPDSRRIAFTCKVDPERTDKADPESDVRVITSARYKFDGQGFLEDKVRQIWTIDALAEKPEPTRITSGHIRSRIAPLVADRS